MKRIRETAQRAARPPKIDPALIPTEPPAFDPYAQIPTSVRIGGYDYRIEVVAESLFDAKSLYGQVMHKELLIQVSAGLNPHHIGNTLLHEIIHAIHFVYVPHEAESSEEDITNQTANGLHQVFRDSPAFGPWMLMCFSA